MSDATWSDLFATIRKTLFIPLHPAGWPFVAGGAIASILLALIWDGFGVLGLILTLYCVYFFRDPVRNVPQKAGLIIAPADGLVCDIKTNIGLPLELDQAKTLEETYTRISIFLSVFDVHVNRIAADGTVAQIVYNPGKFLNAALDKASDENERSAVLLNLDDGREMAFVQIAGWVARRIINNLTTGQVVKKGDRYGIIRFGSRADIYLPQGVAPQVSVGQRMIGGETILADLSSGAPALETKPV